MSGITQHDQMVVSQYIVGKYNASSNIWLKVHLEKGEYTSNRL